MALFDYAADEVIARIVYFGPEQAGKATNLRRFHDTLSAANKCELLTLTTETGRTLVFDFVPPEPGRIRGMRMRVQLCALTGPLSSATAPRAVLKGADGVVFVADSQAGALEANAQSLDSLYRNLLRNRIDLTIPIVIQYNKRDLATALPLETLGQKLNSRGLPSFEAIAIQGIGVEETLRVITRLCFRALVAQYGEAEGLLAASAVARPARVPTHQSLARESLAPKPGEAAARRAATIPFTKLELLDKPRAEDEPPAGVAQVAPGDGTAPPTKRG